MDEELLRLGKTFKADMTQPGLNATRVEVFEHFIWAEDLIRSN